MRPAPGRHLVVLVVAGFLLIGSGLAVALATPRADAPDIGAPDVLAGPPPSVPEPRPPKPVVAPAAPEVPPAPVSISLPAVREPVPLVPVGVLGSGALQLPDRPSVLGWYAAGAVPGDPTGTAVVAGHVDSAEFGPGPLETLFALRVGDVIVIGGAEGQGRRYAVESRTSYPKSALPAEVFRTDGPPRLALVTCGGAFDERSGRYEDNVVVLAVPQPIG